MLPSIGERVKATKEETTIEMILNHSAGLPAIKTEVKEGGFFIGEDSNDELIRIVICCPM